MSRQKAVDALRAARVADSKAKQQAVRDALAEAVEAGVPFTVSAIAEQAGVSRQFLYSHPDLRALVETSVRTPRKRPVRPAANGDVEDGLRATQTTLAAKVERQRITITELRARLEDLEAQRKRWLGSQLESRATIDPVEHADLRAAADRLMDDNAALRRKVAELERLNSMHLLDLAAVRQALSEALADHGVGDGGPVVSLHGRTSRNAPANSTPGA